MVADYLLDGFIEYMNEVAGIKSRGLGGGFRWLNAILLHSVFARRCEFFPGGMWSFFLKKHFLFFCFRLR